MSYKQYDSNQAKKDLIDYAKLAAFIVTVTVATISFFTPRTAHNALADEFKAYKNISSTEAKISLDLLCKLSVKLIGKDAVDEYCLRQLNKGR